MDKLERLRQGSVNDEEYRQQMELLLLRLGLGRRKEQVLLGSLVDLIWK